MEYRKGIKNGSAASQRGLAWLLATCPDEKMRDGAAAVELAEKAAAGSRRFGYREFLDTLAAAYAEAGRFDNAASSAARAEQIASNDGKTDLADHFAQRRELYRQGKPFHRVAGATTQPFNP